MYRVRAQVSPPEPLGAGRRLPGAAAGPKWAKARITAGIINPAKKLAHVGNARVTLVHNSLGMDATKMQSLTAPPHPPSLSSWAELPHFWGQQWNISTTHMYR